MRSEEGRETRQFAGTKVKSDRGHLATAIAEWATHERLFVPVNLTNHGPKQDPHRRFAHAQRTSLGHRRDVDRDAAHWPWYHGGLLQYLYSAPLVGCARGNFRHRGHTVATGCAPVLPLTNGLWLGCGKTHVLQPSQSPFVAPCLLLGGGLRSDSPAIRLGKCGTVTGNLAWPSVVSSPLIPTLRHLRHDEGSCLQVLG